MASITTFFRLEPDPLRPDVTVGATAPLHDPLWLLARQWQTGEFAAQDGGTPVVARWRGRPGSWPATFRPTPSCRHRASMRRRHRWRR